MTKNMITILIIIMFIMMVVTVVVILVMLLPDGLPHSVSPDRDLDDLDGIS